MLSEPSHPVATDADGNIHPVRPRPLTLLRPPLADLARLDPPERHHMPGRFGLNILLGCDGGGAVDLGVPCLHHVPHV
mgnify:CR=1 FL=1|eukprot:scaffold275_cov42-Tisochrysis_lutea.AAC.1